MDENMDGHMDGRTDERTGVKQYLSAILQSGGVNDKISYSFDVMAWQRILGKGRKSKNQNAQ